MSNRQKIEDARNAILFQLTSPHPGVNRNFLAQLWKQITNQAIKQ